jgi:hypothetical protein
MSIYRRRPRSDETVTGTDLVAVHYKGAAPTLQDVIAGRVQLMFISVGNAVPQSKSGAVKFIAIGAPKRMALLPDVPTIAEVGYPGFTAVSWFALYGPAEAFRPMWSPRSMARCARSSPIRPFRRRFSTRNISNPSKIADRRLAREIGQCWPNIREIELQRPRYVSLIAGNVARIHVSGKHPVETVLAG